METLSETKRRLKAIKSIVKVTKAMYLVAASKMKKTQTLAVQNRAYSEKLLDIAQTLSMSPERIHPYLDVFHSNASKEILIIVFSTQRGLAGSLPSQMFKFTLNKINELSQRKAVKVITVGKKIGQQLAGKNIQLIADFSDIPEVPSSLDTREIIRYVSNEYLIKKYAGIYIIYPEFINALTTAPKLVKLLPIESTEIITSHASQSNFLFEPDREELLSSLLSLYLQNMIFKYRIETVTSEFSSRMIAMKSANENSTDLQSELIKEFNKSRQSQITQELSEINASAKYEQ
jgi:F-type H+-transporting ATPase subunit gamma